MKLENQIVGPQAGYIRGGIPALERVIEVVGQENRFQQGGLPDLPIPLLTIAIAQRTVVKVADRLGIDPVVCENVKRPCNLHQPGVLDRVIDPLEILGQVERPCPRIEARTHPIGRHPGGVGELGIVMVSQNLIQVAGSRTMRVNMRMGIKDRPACQLVEQFSRNRIKWSDHAAGGRHHERLEKRLLAVRAEPARTDPLQHARWSA